MITQIFIAMSIPTVIFFWKTSGIVKMYFIILCSHNFNNYKYNQSNYKLYFLNNVLVFLLTILPLMKYKVFKSNTFLCYCRIVCLLNVVLF